MGIQQMLLASAGGGAVMGLLSGGNTFLVGVGASQATASFQFVGDGTVYPLNSSFYDPTNSGSNSGVTGTDWYLPTTTSIGSSYWLEMLSPSVGTFTAGTTGSRVAISGNPNYTCTTTGGTITRQKYVKADFKIWDSASGGTQVGSGTITLSASVDNS